MAIIKHKTQKDAAVLTWQRTKAAEKEFKKIYKNYETYHRGWPDFIAFNKRGNFYFVECKVINEFRDNVSDVLGYEQNKVRKILEKISKKKFHYEIWFFENKKGSKGIVKKAFCDGNKLVPY